MMKKLLFLFSFLISFSAFGQIYQTTSVYGIQYKREKADSAWHPPFVVSLTVLDNIAYPAIAVYRNDTAVWLSKNGITYTVKLLDYRDTLRSASKSIATKYYVDSSVTAMGGASSLQAVTTIGSSTTHSMTVTNGGAQTNAMTATGNTATDISSGNTLFTGMYGLTPAFIATTGGFNGLFQFPTLPSAKTWNVPPRSGTFVLQFPTSTVSNAGNLTVPSLWVSYHLADLTSAGVSRTITVPTSGLTVGDMLKFWNKNASGTHSWSFVGTNVKDAAGTTITTLVNQSWYILEWDGTNWNKQN